MSAHRKARSARRWMLPASLLSVAVGATGLGVAVATEEPRSTPEDVAAVDQAPNWVDVLAGLDRARARAFAAGDEILLAEIYTAGAPALVEDRSLLRQYRERGLRVRGLRMEVVDVRLLSASAHSAVLRVRDRISGGTAVRTAGDSARGSDAGSAKLPADGWSMHRIALRRTVDGWRIASIS